MAGMLDNPDGAYAKLREMGTGLFGGGAGNALMQGIGGFIDRLGKDGKHSSPPAAADDCRRLRVRGCPHRNRRRSLNRCRRRNRKLNLSRCRPRSPRLSLSPNLNLSPSRRRLKARSATFCDLLSRWSRPRHVSHDQLIAGARVFDRNIRRSRSWLLRWLPISFKSRAVHGQAFGSADHDEPI